MVIETHSRQVVRVPDVVGHAVRKGRLIIENLGLEVDEVLFRESYENQNTVIEQVPARGQMVYQGSSVTLYVARRGYMELLPALYRRSDALGRNVVRDICFIFEHMFGSVEAILDTGDRFYNPAECPEEFLPWLASWTAMVVDLDWPEKKKRALLKRSVDLYRIRGTRRGLTLFLKLFIGKEPTIEENVWPFSGFRLGVDARIGIDSVVMPQVNLAHAFVVTIPMKFDEVTPEMVIRIHDIIQREKPAHTHYYLRFAEDQGDEQLREFYTIGVRSGIGIDAEIVDGSEQELSIVYATAAPLEKQPPTKGSSSARAEPEQESASSRDVRELPSLADEPGDDSIGESTEVEIKLPETEFGTTVPSTERSPVDGHPDGDDDGQDDGDDT